MLFGAVVLRGRIFPFSFLAFFADTTPHAIHRFPTFRTLIRFAGIAHFTPPLAPSAFIAIGTAALVWFLAFCSVASDAVFPRFLAQIFCIGAVFAMPTVIRSFDGSNTGDVDEEGAEIDHDGVPEDVQIQKAFIGRGLAVGSPQNTVCIDLFQQWTVRICAVMLPVAPIHHVAVGVHEILPQQLAE